MIARHLVFFAMLLAASTSWVLAQAGKPDTPPAGHYYPDAIWERKAPADSGIDPKRLKEAVDFAIARESPSPRNQAMDQARIFGGEPFSQVIGPMKDRGDPTGLIIHHGYIVAEWGEPQRVDMTHSVTKSFLSSIVGLASDRGMIRSINDAVRDYVPPVQAYNSPVNVERTNTPDLISPFDTPHNRTIAWDHLLRQTSDWEGTLWGKPDWADRPEGSSGERPTRPRHQPGAVFKYNDVRVNVLALAALNVWRRPLPQVLKDNMMDPIGASNTWRWYGYDNAWIVLDGNVVQSVSGGGHWGGGMFINAFDMGRFGLLTLHNGKWRDRQLISERWMEWARTPTPALRSYGFMNFFLNTNQQMLPSAPATAFAHIGNGTNMIYVDPEHDVVAVVRWIGGGTDGFVQRLLAALK